MDIYISKKCPHCKKLLIGRNWYKLSDWNLDKNGHCTFCGTKCSGVFEKVPGNWGSKRISLRIKNYS